MFELDVHTHTLASGHAYSTVLENIREAKAKGLKGLGMSDHAPAMVGTTYQGFFMNLGIIPDEVEGIRVLKGVEANIINYDGGIDMNELDMSKLDYGIASLHIPCINPSNKKDNTRAIIGAMKHPGIHIIGHPDDDRYPKDYAEIAKAAKHYDVLLEVNNTSMRPGGFRSNAKGEILKYLEICAKEEVRIVCNSDAHFAPEVGDFTRCIDVIEEVGFPKELVISHSLDEFLKKIGK